MQFPSHSGWSERDPADWIAALDAVIAEMRAKYPAFAGVKGIGVAGHMHGATLLDASGAVITLHPVERHPQPRRGGAARRHRGVTPSQATSSFRVHRAQARMGPGTPGPRPGRA
ncbi:MAG: hypothetical protein R3D80_18610 [Paracoccaceae bacterium]